MRFQSHAALMLDAVNVLVEAFSRVLRKKPDGFRGGKKNSNGQTVPALGNGTRNIDCYAKQPQGWEHGDKISRIMRKVRPLFWNFHVGNF